MKISVSQKGRTALTLIEVLVIVAIIAILAAILLPGINSPRRPALSVSCLNNEKQLGLSFLMYSSDNNGGFPMQMSVTNGGWLSYATNGSAADQFYVVLPYTANAATLICPFDTDRKPANGTNLLNANISYFVDLDVRTNLPDWSIMPLLGDRILSFDGRQIASGLVTLTRDENYLTVITPHKKLRPNIGFADGHAQAVADIDVFATLTAIVATNHLAMP